MTTARLQTIGGADAGARGSEDAVHASGRWAMRLVIATEACFFGYLLFSYWYLAAFATTWPPHDAQVSLHLALPNTGILLASSALLIWGESGIKRGRIGQLRAGLALTTALGALFVAVQFVEWSRQTVTPSGSLWGSVFFTITGFHVAHVCVGLLMLVVVQVGAWRGAFTARRHGYVSNAALYWHFVDVVWLAVFTSLYLVPVLNR